jgi:hypothetical protein
MAVIIAQLLAVAIVLVALGMGAWLALAGAVLIASERAFRIRIGVAALLLGLFFFMAGAIGCARMIA